MTTCLCTGITGKTTLYYSNWLSLAKLSGDFVYFVHYVIFFTFIKWYDENAKYNFSYLKKICDYSFIFFLEYR